MMGKFHFFSGFSRPILRAGLALALFLTLFVAQVGPAAAAGGKGVYTLTNAASGNQVVAFSRAGDGTLTPLGTYDTGGLGSGASLSSQGALASSENGGWLFAVNAGSNEVSAFAVNPDGLTLVDKVPSGGLMPVSLTVYKNWLYVLNAGGNGNIAGFQIAPDGKLSLLAGSIQPLSNGGIGAAPGPAQISFSASGEVLAVTEKATNLIDVYRVGEGIASGPQVHASSGVTPYGFAFTHRNLMVVSEAFGGVPGATAVSSYTVSQATFEVESPSVPSQQSAACWVAISKNGKYAYVSNAASNNLSLYRITRDGKLDLVAGNAASATGPLELDFSVNGRYLYALASGSHTIEAFQMQADGSLVHLQSASIPAGAYGIAAY